MKQYENNHKDALWNTLHRQVVEQRERKKDKNFVAGKIGGSAYQPQDSVDHNINTVKQHTVNRRSMSPLDRFNIFNDDDRLRALMPQQETAGRQREPSQYSEISPTKVQVSKRLSTWDRYVHASDENRLSKLLSSSNNNLSRNAPRAGTETSLAIGSEHPHQDEKKAQYKRFLLQQIEEKKQRGRHVHGNIGSDGGWFNNEQRKIHTHRGEYRRDRPAYNGDLDRQEWGSPQPKRNPLDSGGEHYNHNPSAAVAASAHNDGSALRKELLKNDLLMQIEEKMARKQAEKDAELGMNQQPYRNQPNLSRNVSPNVTRNPREAVEHSPMYSNQWGSPNIAQYDQSLHKHVEAPLNSSMNNNTSKPKLAATYDQISAAEEQRAKVLQLKYELENQIEEKKRVKAAQQQHEKEEEERIEREVQRVVKEEQDRVEAEKEKRRQKVIEDENARLHVAAMVQQEEDRKAETARRIPPAVAQNDVHQSSLKPTAKAFIQVGHTESPPHVEVRNEYRGYRSELPGDDSYNNGSPHQQEAPPRQQEAPPRQQEAPPRYIEPVLPAPQVYAAKNSFEKYIRDVDERPFERDTVLGRNKWNPTDHQSPEAERRNPYSYNRESDVKQDFNQRQPEPMSLTVLEEAHHRVIVRESPPPESSKFVFNHHTTNQHSSSQVTASSPPLLLSARPLDEPEGPDSLEGSCIIIRDPDTPSKSPVARHVVGGRDRRRKSLQDVRTSLEALHRVIVEEPMPEKVATYKPNYEREPGPPTPVVSHERDTISQHYEITPIKEESTPYKSFLETEPASVGGLSRFDFGHYNTNVDSMYRLPPMDRVTQLDTDEESHHGRILSKTHQSPKTLKPLHNAPAVKKGNTVSGLSQLERDLMAEVSAMARDRQSHRLRPIQRPLEVYVVEDDYRPF